MKLFQRLFIVCAVLSVFLVRCKCPGPGEDLKPDGGVEFLAKGGTGAKSKTWKAKSVTEDGVATTLDISKFEMTFNYDGMAAPNGKATTYTVVPGGLPFNPAPANSGTWSVNTALTEITFNTTAVPVSGLSAAGMTFNFKYKKDPNKATETAVVMMLQPK